ncbi:50S ribosomal protein L28 [Pseudactinotalea sp.]|uniref:50S ribosomal protein L28 n=1 Tax=Pseudactinotalea sp. TaxID=1926260 RepID=UPI003B3B0ED1
MSTYCQLTGATPRFGRSISHSHRRTSRRFNPNLQTRRYRIPSLGRTVKLTLSTKAIKTIDRIGIEAAVLRMRERGEAI